MINKVSLISISALFCCCLLNTFLGTTDASRCHRQLDPCYKGRCAANQTCTTGCAPTCTPTCKEPEPICTLQCIMNGTNCVCKEGYVVGPKGNCIKLTDCAPPTCKGAHCGKNQTCSVCEPTCYPSCENPNIPCTDVCRLVGSKYFCPCAPDYVIGPEGNCILQKDCPKNVGCLSGGQVCTSDDQCCGPYKKCCGPGMRPPNNTAIVRRCFDFPFCPP